MARKLTVAGRIEAHGATDRPAVFVDLAVGRHRAAREVATGPALSAASTLGQFATLPTGTISRLRHVATTAAPQRDQRHGQPCPDSSQHGTQRNADFLAPQGHSDAP